MIPLPAMPTFLEFLRAQPVDSTPAGAFVGNAKRDKLLPALRTWAELRGYLNRIGADDETIAAARSVWRRYRDLMREAP